MTMLKFIIILVLALANVNASNIKTTSTQPPLDKTHVIFYKPDYEYINGKLLTKIQKFDNEKFQLRRKKSHTVLQELLQSIQNKKSHYLIQKLQKSIEQYKRNHPKLTQKYRSQLLHLAQLLKSKPKLQKFYQQIIQYSKQNTLPSGPPTQSPTGPTISPSGPLNGLLSPSTGAPGPPIDTLTDTHTNHTIDTHTDSLTVTTTDCNEESNKSIKESEKEVIDVDAYEEDYIDAFEDQDVIELSETNLKIIIDLIEIDLTQDDITNTVTNTFTKPLTKIPETTTEPENSKPIVTTSIPETTTELEETVTKPIKKRKTRR